MTTPLFSLQDGDLCLRLMSVEDAATVQGCRNLEGVSRYQSWRPRTVTEVEDLAREQVDRRPGMQREACQLVIELRKEDDQTQVIGDMGCGAFDPGRQMEIGIVIDPNWQSRGYARRACSLLFDHLFAAGLHRITARIDTRNEASLRLFDRLAFRREGLERSCWWDEAWHEWCDEACYAMLVQEWAER